MKKQLSALIHSTFGALLITCSPDTNSPYSPPEAAGHLYKRNLASSDVASDQGSSNLLILVGVMIFIFVLLVVAVILIRIYLRSLQAARASRNSPTPSSNVLRIEAEEKVSGSSLELGASTKVTSLKQAIVDNGNQKGQQLLPIPGSVDKSSSGNQNSYSVIETTLVSRTMNDPSPALSLPGYRKATRYEDFNFNDKAAPLKQGGVAKIMFGEIYNPDFREHGQRVVVKVSLRERMSQEDIELFKQEIAIMEILKKGTNIVKFVGYCEDPLCLLMKYYSKGSLDDRIRHHQKRTPLPHQTIIDFTKDMASGLAHMQKSDFAHCDIKPQNVLIDYYETREICVLTDFGFSQVTTDRTMRVKALKKVDRYAISTRYAAPEALERFYGRTTEDERSDPLIWSKIIKAGDIYSLAITIWVMVNNKGAWKDSDKAKKVEKKAENNA